MGVAIRVWGPLACFTRPEMKAERVSYDVITPSAARGILESIYWKPQIRWVVDRIHVLRPIRFTSLRRNEVGSRIPVKGASGIQAAMDSGKGALGMYVEDERQQRASLLLRDVEYVIEAHFEVLDATDADGKGLSPNQAAAKHLDQFNRRARSGQCFQRPSLGCREFACDFTLIEPPTELNGLKPESGGLGEAFYGTDAATRDLGFMLHDLEYAPDAAGAIVEGGSGRRVTATARFFRASMVKGVIDIPGLRSPEVRS